MEQKKTLWIITAAGFFLAVVILAAMLVNKADASDVPRTASVTTIEKPKAAEPVEYTETSVNAESDENVSEEAVDGNAVSNLACVDSLGVETLNVESVNVENLNVTSNGTVTIDLNNTSSDGNVVAKSNAAKEAMQNKKESEKASTIYTAAPAVKSNAEKTAEKKAAAMNKNLKSTSVASKPASAPVTSVEVPKYWVQAASYTSKKTADFARAALEESRIPAEVFTFKDSKNKLFYRLRVGPYTTKSEAEYWKNRVAQIEQFKNVQSYITVN